jgi:alkaline phosphatase D
LAVDPDVWIWLGDNIYGDSKDQEVLKAKYDKQKSNELYQKLLEKTKVFGIWDDHDFGLNDGGKEFEGKEDSKLVMFDFLDVPETNPAYHRKGTYQSYDLALKDVDIKLLLLDSRYFRDNPIKMNGQYQPNLNGTILGEEQWTWLGEMLRNDSADVTLIGNGIQIIPEDHRYEKWANFPSERARLFDSINVSGINNVILLSGDRHLSELSKLDVEGMASPLYEITSSGLTHVYSNFQGETNKHRVGEVVAEKSFGLLEIEKDTVGLKVILKFMGDDGAVYQELVLY